MHKTKNTLPLKTRTQVAELLNHVLASCLDAMCNAKQAHWNVKGPHFIALHELFDEVFEGLEEYTDTIAERIIQLGGVAEATVQVIKQRTQLKAYPLSASEGLSHADYLSDTLAALGKVVREGIDTCAKLGDADAADILTEVSRGIDKHLWFVEAHLEGKK